VPFTPHRVVDIASAGAAPGPLAIWKTFAEAATGLAGALGQAWRVAPPPAAHPGGFRALLDTLAGAFDQIADEGRVLFATLEDFITGTFPIIGLKQFRDVAQSDRACYQAITDAPMKIGGFHGGGLLGDYVVNLGDLASEPIRQDLGLPPGPIRPLLSAWLRYDFRLDAGIELWNAGR
jgi:hypothetical protein